MASDQWAWFAAKGMTNLPYPDPSGQAPLAPGADGKWEIDETLTVDVVGAAGQTIGYEILTSLGRRYRRVYLE